MAMGFSITLTTSPVLRDILGRFASLRDGEAMARVQQQMSMTAYRALTIAQMYAPKDTGAFASGLSAVPYGQAGFAIISDDPTLLNRLRTGTGIYAGRGRIYPTNAKAMVFGRWPSAMMPPNYRGMFAFSSIAGMAANPWEASAQADIEASTYDELSKVLVQWAYVLGVGEVV